MMLTLVCPECGYNLTGLIESRCPECGTPFDRAELIRSAFDHNKPVTPLEVLGKILPLPIGFTICLALARSEVLVAIGLAILIGLTTLFLAPVIAIRIANRLAIARERRTPLAAFRIN